MDQYHQPKTNSSPIKALQLHRWKNSSVSLSHFDEASLSPSRGTLLLHFKQNGALLVPVRSAKNEDTIASAGDPPPPPPSSTAGHGTSSLVHSTSDSSSIPVMKTATSSVDIRDPEFSASGSPVQNSPSTIDKTWDSFSSLDFTHAPFVADCVSFCWGCCTEGYSTEKQTGMFKELLLVKAKHGLVIHGLPGRTSKAEKPACNASQSFETSEMNAAGRWINWGLHSSGSDRSRREPIEPLSGREEMMGFVTFLADAQVKKHANTLSLNFMEGRVQNSSGKIHSYSIPFDSSAFLCLVRYVEERCCIPQKKEMTSLMSLERLFAGPSFNFVGFLLSRKEDSTEDSSGFRFFILVCKISSSGLEWFSVVEPSKALAAISVNEWPMFAFSGGNLYGLHEKGHIYVWSLSDANLLLHIDVLQDCGLHHINRLEEEKYSNGGNFIDNFQGRGIPQSHNRKFKHMVLGVNSPFIAVTDSWAFVYVVATSSYIRGSRITETGPTCCKTSPSWAVGSTHTGCRLPCEIRNRKQFAPNSKCGLVGGPFASCTSGFSSKSLLARPGLSKVCSANHENTPIRRLFIPLNKHSRITSICMNVFGIMQMNSAKQHPQGCQTAVEITHFSGEVSDDCTSGVHQKLLLNSVSEEIFLPFCWQGYLYYVSKDGLYVILPSLSFSASSSGYDGQWWFTGRESELESGSLETSSGVNIAVPKLKDWQFEVLDKALIYDGFLEAEHLAAVNGWSRHVVRLRRLQLALEYVQLDQIEQALDGIVAVKGAESGVARVLFTAVQLILDHSSGDNEFAQASRLLTLASRFTTKLIRQYGIQRHNSRFESFAANSRSFKILNECSNELKDMARFLEVIRKLRLQLRKKRSHPQPGKKEIGDMYGAELPVNGGETDQHFERSPPEDESRQLSNVVGLFNNEDSMWLVKGGETSTFLSSEQIFDHWEKENKGFSMIVREALRAGRLPLAVVQLHRLQFKDLVYQQPQIQKPQIQSTFKEVQGIGRAFIYELLCKGETTNAMIALSRLGEDVEMVLRELALGTVSRSLRSQAINELGRLGCLNSQDSNMLEIISHLERAYPNNSFWGSYGAQQRSLPEPTGSSMKETSSDPDLQLLCSLEKSHDLTIACGEIDGVVLGEWSSLEISKTSQTFLEELSPGYWAGAAVWLTELDKLTLDKVFVDQEMVVIENASWEAFLQTAIARHDWKWASSLLDSIPDSALQEGELRVRLDCQETPNSVSSLLSELKSEEMKQQNGLDNLGVDAVEIAVPNVRLLAVPLGTMCTGWMRGMLEEKLVHSGIFMRSYWYGTRELISLLAKAGVLFRPLDKLEKVSKSQKETKQAIHELVLRHCVRFSLPNFMAGYLDHHSLALDAMSSTIMQAVVGDCRWALWLLLSRIRGREFDASFANAHTVLARNFKPGQLPVASDSDEFLSTVDDMAMAGGEMMALCTLMYAPIALEKCLATGSVNRYDGPSWQCTLENLRPGLQQYPTLWHALVTASFNPDTWCFAASPQPKAVRGKTGLAGYLEWREQLYFSACGDTSILQMMPRWLPKHIQRLLQLSVQGPVGGGQAVVQGGFLPHHGLHLGEVDPVVWETSLQKSIEDELYASSKLKEKAVGVEHHLRRGRAMAAFNSFLAIRLQNLNAHGSLIREHVGKFQKGQLHMSSELHALLSPLANHEENYIASVLPLAITNFENPIVVAACASFLELCGLPATMLRIDVAALRRIGDFCKASTKSDFLGDRSDVYGNDVASSLARALADEYMETGVTVLAPKKTEIPGKFLSSTKTSRVLMEVLHILEKASYKERSRSDSSPGLWLVNGKGDGFQLREQQRDASERWNLVTNFCTIHQLPISTVYLVALARDNDWVGFLAEAQSEGCPLDLLVSVVSREFSDSRLQSHILTVLKSLQSAWQKPSTLTTSSRPNGFGDAAASSELFEILAECEHQKNSGAALLARAKELRWPFLAVVASCFTDVTPVSGLTVWLEITAARETSAIKVNDAAAHIAACVGAAVEATNRLPESSHIVDFQYNRKSSKRRRLLPLERHESDVSSISTTPAELKENLPRSESTPKDVTSGGRTSFESQQRIQGLLGTTSTHDGSVEQESLSKMIAILCEQQRFSPLLKAFDLFMPSSPLLPFIRFLQAFAQMRLSEASTHLAVFSARLREDVHPTQHTQHRSNRISTGWITVAAITAADTMLTSCPSAYERRRLLQLLAGANFNDGGAAALRFRRLYWKVQLGEPVRHHDSKVTAVDLDDDALLLALEKERKWEEARNWARQLESSGQNPKAVNHVTETQAEAMVAEWRELLWDLKDERVALWSHCQELFLRNSFPPQQAGMFFLKHAEALEQDVPPSELHGILLLALQWLSGSITNTSPSFPIQQLRELESRIWLLAAEPQMDRQEDYQRFPSKSAPEQPKTNQDTVGSSPVILDSIGLTAKTVSTVDSHIKSFQARVLEASADGREGAAEGRHANPQDQSSPSAMAGANAKAKRKPRNYVHHRKAHADKPTKPQSEFEGNTQSGASLNKKIDPKLNNVHEDPKDDTVASEDQLYWEERVSEQELEQAILSLLEVGQLSAARQLQKKLAPVHIPFELLLVESALNIANLSTPTVKGCVDPSMLNPSVREHLAMSNVMNDLSSVTPFEVLDVLTKACREGCGRGSCKRITAVARVAYFLDMPFSEAFDKQPAQLLQLLSLKAQDSLSEARLLVGTHSMPAASIAKILAESYFKGLLAAHRGGYMESSLREEGPSPLLWRPSDFLKWAELCPSEPEIGHALLRIVVRGHDVPHACEVELLVRAHHFYMSSACLDGIDVLLELAATRVESFIAEGDFTSLARLVTGINNFQSLHFLLDILIENGQLELLLQKRAVGEAAMESSASVRGFRMAVLSTLKHFNPNDLDAFATVYDQFDMKHEMAALMESRANKGLEQWLQHHDPEFSEELLETMRYNVEAAEVWASVDAGNKARWNCAQASLISLQLRIPELTWLNLTETNARRLFVDQSRFQEALVVAEAYKLNQPGEWVPVLWNQMPNPGWVDQFLSEFVAALPLPPNMLMELARFYRAEVTARGDQIDFSLWLSRGGMPLDWAKYLGKSFRCLLKYVRDMRLRVQLATLATGFPDVLDVCMRILDKVPDTAGPLVLRKGHGGGYLPLM